LPKVAASDKPWKWRMEQQTCFAWVRHSRNAMSISQHDNGTEAVDTTVIGRHLDEVRSDDGAARDKASKGRFL
jgi:hypothetical protein